MQEDQELRKKLVGTRIQTNRKSRGVTQADLAAKLGISRPLLTNIEAGRRAASVDLVKKIATALQVSPLALLSEYDAKGAA